MFHYRLAATNNRSRMLIAVLLATVVHIGLMSFEFKPKQIFVPSISLPRSVSVFLRQSSIVQTPDQPVKEIQNVKHTKKEHFKAEKEPELPVFQEEPAIIRKPESLVQSQTMLKEAVAQPAVEDIVPVHQEPENAINDLKPEAGEAPMVQELATQTKPQAVQEEEGVNLPGTLQLAYPRYQLNRPPAYPGLARKRGQEGTVILQVLVSRAGRVDDLKIDASSNFSLLDRAAVSAVRKWKFEPGKRGEEKIPMWVRVPVTFKLK